MRKTFKSLLSLSAVIFIAGLYNSSVYGVPAFARQTGLDCTSCHGTFGYPSLNSFGAAFKAGGYTNASEDSLMGDGEDLSLPKVLNMSSVLKVRAIFEDNFTGGFGTTGLAEMNVPDEFSLFYGGRVSKNIGVKVEFALVEPAAALSFAMPIAYPVGPVTIGAVPYWTDAAGPAWFFETLTTGNASNIRAVEKHKGPIHPDGNVGSNFAAAAGMGFYVWHPMGFVGYSPFVDYSAAHPNAESPTQAAHYIRAAATPTVGPVDLAVGFMMTTGKKQTNGMGSICYGAASKLVADGTAADIDTALATAPECQDGNLGRDNAGKIGVDFQVMGNVGIPIGFTFSWAKYTPNKDDADVYKSGLGFYFEAAPVENLLNVGVGYELDSNSDYDTTGKIATNDDGSNLIVALKVNLARNVRYHFEMVKGMATDKKTMQYTNMIFAAF